MRCAGAEAREVLEKFRDNHTFDPEKVLATELHVVLDENYFLPIESFADDGRTAEFEGTLDLVVVHSVTEAEIDDWKSYYQIIDAEKGVSTGTGNPDSSQHVLRIKPKGGSINEHVQRYAEL